MEKKYIKDYIARRTAQELKDGFVVNLGVGLPTLCTKYLPEGTKICIHAEVGIVGAGATPVEGDANYDPLHVVDAGGSPAAYRWDKSPNCCTRKVAIPCSRSSVTTVVTEVGSATKLCQRGIGDTESRWLSSTASTPK